MKTRARSRRVAALIGCACLWFSTTVACGRESPATGTPTSPTPPGAAVPAPPSVTYRVHGRVLDNGALPVSGAGVTPVLDSSVSSVTDEGGSYSLTFTPPRVRPAGIGVRVAKEGYEPAYHNVYFGESHEAQRDLRVHRLLGIAAGESASVTVDPDDSPCGSEDEFACRIVRVRSVAGGTLIAEVSPPLAWLAFREVKYPFLGSSVIGTDVDSGDETPILILLPYYWDQPPPVTVTLRTSVEPR